MRFDGMDRHTKLAGDVLTPRSTGRVRGSARRCAFTLIELLVTISVIAVLIGILLPALRVARRNSEDLLCRARMRSIGAMYEVYATEHRGELPTLKYPPRPNGEPDVILVRWGPVGSWLVLPVVEMFFWAFPLRDYAADNSDSQMLRAVEALSCPVPFDRWYNDRLTPEERDGTIQPFDPMHSPQASYRHSLALFTAPSGWSSDTPPEVNAIHATVRLSDVAHPSRKASLVEDSSYHEARTAQIGEEAAGPLRFNILAVDGHVERRTADEAADPVGFTAFYTGFESPPMNFDTYAENGLRYISTRDGALGRDW